ncbi:MAG TPA: DMT family transporter [Planctomycetota bacterium]|nr:DMT family transporter [Planctomycetota bacterium]
MVDGPPVLPGAPPRDGSAAEREAGARTKGYAALVVVQFAFALFTVFGKWALVDFSAKAIVGWRIVAGALGVGSAVLFLRGKRALPSWADLAKLAVLGLLGITINMVVFLEGLKRSTAMNAGLIVPMIPVFTFAVAVLVGHERFCWSRGIGILIALAATIALAFERGAQVSESTTHGNLLLIASTFCYSLYLVFSRPLVAKYGPLIVIAWVFVLSLWSVPLFAGHEAWIPEHVSAKSWASLAYILVFPTIVAYFLNAYALARVASSTTAVFIFFQSLITITCAVLILHDAPTTRTIACGAVVFVGTALVLFGPQKKVLASP